MSEIDESKPLEHIKMRLAQIASGDYKACGVTAEECAADALFSFKELESTRTNTVTDAVALQGNERIKLGADLGK